MEFKRGQRVLVAEKKWSPTWICAWSPHMDGAVGKEGFVTRVDLFGVHISFDGTDIWELFAFPIESVQPVGLIDVDDVSKSAELKALHMRRRDMVHRIGGHPELDEDARVVAEFLKQLDKLFPAGKTVA